MKEAPIIVLEALLLGMKIKIKDWEVVMGIDEEANKHILCFECESYNSNDPSNKTIKYLRFPMDFDDFVNFCYNMPKEELDKISATVAFSKIKGKK